MKPKQVDLPSAKLVRYFGNAGLGAGFLLCLSHGGSAQADAANGFLADFDRNPAAERNYIGKHALPSIGCFGELRPIGRRAFIAPHSWFGRYTSFGFLHIIPTRPIDGWNGDSNLPTKTFRQTSGADEVQ